MATVPVRPVLVLYEYCTYTSYGDETGMNLSGREKVSGEVLDEILGLAIAVLIPRITVPEYGVPVSNVRVQYVLYTIRM